MAAPYISSDDDVAFGSRYQSIEENTSMISLKFCKTFSEYIRRKLSNFLSDPKKEGKD